MPLRCLNAFELDVALHDLPAEIPLPALHGSPGWFGHEKPVTGHPEGAVFSFSCPGVLLI